MIRVAVAGEAAAVAVVRCSLCLLGVMGFVCIDSEAVDIHVFNLLGQG